jgi:hypothetical protein
MGISSFGQDELVIAGNPEGVEITVMLDPDFLRPLEQVSSGNDARPSGCVPGLGRLMDRRRHGRLHLGSCGASYLRHGSIPLSCVTRMITIRINMSSSDMNKFQDRQDRCVGSRSARGHEVVDQNWHQATVERAVNAGEMTGASV